MWRSHDETLVFVYRRTVTSKRIAYRVMSTALIQREQSAGNWARKFKGAIGAARLRFEGRELENS